MYTVFTWVPDGKIKHDHSYLKRHISATFVSPGISNDTKIFSSPNRNTTLSEVYKHSFKDLFFLCIVNTKVHANKFKIENINKSPRS